MRIALVSLDQVWEDKAANKIKVAKYLEIAKKYCSNFVIFPEMTLTGFSFNEKVVPEVIKKSETKNFFSQIAKHFNMPIVYGFVGIKNGQTKPNNLLAFANRGIQNKVIYEKSHLFSMAKENKYCAKGKIKSKIELDGISLGASICYDLRFPEVFRTQAKSLSGCLNIANWPNTRVDHWFSLLKARAIENQYFMIGVNRVGIDGKMLEYLESSEIFDPFGKRLLPETKKKNVKIYDIDFSVVKEVRTRFPFLKDM